LDTEQMLKQGNAIVIADAQIDDRQVKYFCRRLFYRLATRLC
jgi:hypothetical protein